MESPLFSIITVTYNAEHTIERTLKSVASQTFEDYEHIVIDGASTDATLDIISKAPDRNKICLLSEKDNGIYDAMNKGIGRSTGQYLIFLNSGDKFHSAETLEKIASVINENGNPDIVYGQTDLVADDGRFVAKRHLTAPKELKLQDFANGMLVCHQAFIVRKEIAPYYSLKYKYSADYEWCIMCLMHSQKNILIDEPLIDYLIEGQTTLNRKASLRERFDIMSTYFGFWRTAWKHIGFIGRYRRHNKEVKKGLRDIK